MGGARRCRRGVDGPSLLCPAGLWGPRVWTPQAMTPCAHVNCPSRRVLRSAEGAVMPDPRPLPPEPPIDRLTGHAPAMHTLRTQIRQLAVFDAVGSVYV